MNMMLESRGGGQEPPDHRGVKPYDGQSWDLDIDIILDGKRVGGSLFVATTPLRENVADRLRLLALEIEGGRFVFEDGS